MSPEGGNAPAAQPPREGSAQSGHTGWSVALDGQSHVCHTGRVTPPACGGALMTTFPEMRQWLARHPDLDEVFSQMIDADGGGGCWFMASPTMGPDEIWSNNGPSVAVTRSASSILHDLDSQGLIRLANYDSNGYAQYELPADAREFERWRRGLPSPVEQVEKQMLRLANDAGFADRHPNAAKHLRAAFELLAAVPLDVADTTIFGNHLRKAPIDVAGAAAGLASPDEQVERALKPVRQSAAQRDDVAVAMLVDLCLAVLNLDHSINHVRDELKNGREPAGTETLRRAAFLTAVCCYQLDRSPLAAPTGTELAGA